MNCERVSVNGRVTQLFLSDCRLYSVECVCGQKKVYCGLSIAKGAIRGTDKCACESLSCLSRCFRPQLTCLFQNMFLFS